MPVTRYSNSVKDIRDRTAEATQGDLSKRMEDPLSVLSRAIVSPDNGSLVLGPDDYYLDTASTPPRWRVRPSSIFGGGIPLVRDFYGVVVDEQVFGRIRLPTARTFTIGQIEAQVAPTGAAITIDFVNESNVEQSQVMTLAAGASFQETTGLTVAVPAETTYALKIKSIGSTVAGAYLTVTLF